MAWPRPRLKQSTPSRPARLFEREKQMLKMIGAPKRVEIRYIRVDGSAMVDMEKENVKEIAKSLREGGVILHPSLVDKASKKIVCGRDRILAQMRNDMKTALVQAFFLPTP